MDVDLNECKALNAEAEAKKARKKAGFPELELDALPSTLCIKMMTLHPITGSRSGLKGMAADVSFSLPALQTSNLCHLRTCLGKRSMNLQKGLDQFAGYDNLSALQVATLVIIMSCGTYLPRKFQCLALDHTLRMKDKLSSTISRLSAHATEIDRVYAGGVVDGFSEECFLCI